MDEMTVLLAGAGVLAVVQVVLLGLQGFEHCRFARSRLRRLPSPESRGRAMVIIPCRGLDRNLAEHLGGFFIQDYPDYMVRFVTQSLDDPAVPVIRELMGRYPQVPAELVVAGPAEREAQKVHNLRVATRTLPPEIRYLVFADSDAAPARHWLRALVGRLESSGAAAVTGYRWFIPDVGSFREAFLYSLNACYAMLMTRKTPNLVWGGTWAIRRETFESLRIREYWQGQICDDLAVARLLFSRRLHVEYEPSCLVPTPCQLSTQETLGFVQRQYFLLRHVLPGWWLFDVFVGNYHVAVFWLSLGCLFSANAWHRMVALGICVGLLALNGVRAEFRAWASRTYFPELARRAEFRRSVWWDRLCAPLFGLIGWLVSISGGLRRRIRWRGITYEIGRDGEVSICHRGPAEGTPPVGATVGAIPVSGVPGPSETATPVAATRAA